MQVVFTKKAPPQWLLDMWKEIDDKTFGKGFDCYAVDHQRRRGHSVEMFVAAARKPRTPAMPIRSPRMKSARKAKKIRGGGVMTPALPHAAPASDAAPSDEVTTGVSARMRRIANKSPSTATLMVRMSAGSRSHMIDPSDRL